MKKNRVYGSPEQFQAALKHRIQELRGSIQDNVTSATEIGDPASSRFSKVLGSAEYYDYPKYSKTLYLPSYSQGKVKLTIGTFSDPSYDDDNTFES